MPVDVSCTMALSLRKVLISDEIDSKCIDILQRNGIEVDKNTKLSKEALISEIPKYDGLIVRSATKVSADVIAAASNLKIIGRAGTGVDNIDINAATKKGVIVMNTPGGNTLSAAELTCTMILATARNISHGTFTLRQGKWSRSSLMGNEVYGKTLAIIGLGRIGKEVALRMQAFGMTTIGFDPIVPAEVSAEFGVKWLPLEEIWPQADYITVHTPLIPQTKNLINLEVLNKCKKGIRIINVARGGIVDEDGLLQALESGQCAGAGLDVFVEEPTKNTALVEHPRVTGTPHLGASTTEAQSRVAEEIAQQFVDMVQGVSLFGAINAQALSNALSRDTEPWITLGQTLGKLAVTLLGQVNSQTQIQLSTEGVSLQKAGSYLSAAVLVGLLKSQSSNGLNLVSAPAYAKELGLSIKPDHSDKVSNGFPHLVTLSVQQPGGAVQTLSGTVASGKPLLVSINGCKFPHGAPLHGNTLLYRSQANPQVMPAVAGALAGASSSVQSFTVSSVSAEAENWSVMQVLPPIANLEILKLHVNWVQQMDF